MVSVEQVKYLMLSYLWLQYVWTFYLDIRQFRKCKNTVSIPVELFGAMNVDTFEKARCYSLDKLKVDFVANTLCTALNTGIIFGKILPLTWIYVESMTPSKTELAISCLWVFLLTTAYVLLQLPLTAYSTFKVANKYEPTKQTVALFARDLIIEYVLGEVSELSFTAMVVALHARLGEWLFLVLWATTVVLLLVGVALFSVILPKMFVRYNTLPDDHLKAEITRLATSLNFPLTGIYIGRDLGDPDHGNAFFFGVCGTKCIVLFDSLLPRFQTDEILAILAHEMGHWRYRHGLKRMVLVQVDVFFLCFAFYVFVHEPRIYEAVGFSPKAQPLVVGLVVVLQFVLPPVLTVSTVIGNFIDRHHERQADAFCKEMHMQDALKRALIKLDEGDLDFPVDDSLYAFWYYDHPTLLERLRQLN